MYRWGANVPFIKYQTFFKFRFKNEMLKNCFKFIKVHGKC